MSPDTDIVEVTLNKGWNPVLVKVCQAEEGIYGVDHIRGWAFCLQILDSDGKPIQGLRLDPEGDMR